MQSFIPINQHSILLLVEAQFQYTLPFCYFSKYFYSITFYLNFQFISYCYINDNCCCCQIFKGCYFQFDTHNFDVYNLHLGKANDSYFTGCFDSKLVKLMKQCCQKIKSSKFINQNEMHCIVYQSLSSIISLCNISNKINWLFQTNLQYYGKYECTNILVLDQCLAKINFIVIVSKILLVGPWALEQLVSLSVLLMQL